MKVQVLGLCRFSVPSTPGAYQTQYPDMAALTAALYHPDRLAMRFFLFERFLLPAIKAQTDQDFTLVVLMGTDFPEPWRRRMIDLIHDCPQIKAVFRHPGPQRDVCREVFLSHRDPNADLVAEFRLDDDDAVAVDFVAELRGLAPVVAPLVDRAQVAAVDFCKGMMVRPDPQGDLDYTPVIAPYWAAGLGIYNRPQAARCVMDFGHHRVWQFMPVVSLLDPIMFLRGEHGTNDSPIPKNKVAGYKLPQGGAPGVLGERFAVDLADVARHWAALRPTLGRASGQPGQG